MDELIRMMAERYNALIREGQAWRDPSTGKVFGCGPDAFRRAQLLMEAISGFGYGMVSDEDHPGDLYPEFYVPLAKVLEIPEANWPDGAREKYEDQLAEQALEAAREEQGE